MSVPVAVTSYLENNHLRYTVTSIACDTPDAVLVKSILLDDPLGPVQVLVPHYSLLKLNALCEALGRNLVAMHPKKTAELWASLGLKGATAIAAVTHLHTMIDKSLLGYQHFLLESGTPDLLIRVDKVQMGLLLRDGQVETIDSCCDSRQLAFDNDDESQIRRAVETFTPLRMKQRLIETLEIPPLPETARKILKLRINPDSRIEELVAVVEMDPSLNAQLICWASSPYYASPSPITSVQDAISRVLGFDLVLNMALGLSLGKCVNLPKDGPFGLTPYWEQAAFVAHGMQSLVHCLPRHRRRNSNTAYLCGLLHNFGYLVLGHVFPPHFSLVCRHIEANTHLPQHVIERLLLGLSRDQLAGWLLMSWNMSPEVVVALRQQNHPFFQGEHAWYAHLLYVCRQLLAEQGIGPAIENRIPEHIWTSLDLNADEARDSIAALVQDQGPEISRLALQMAS